MKKLCSAPYISARIAVDIFEYASVEYGVNLDFSESIESNTFHFWTNSCQPSTKLTLDYHSSLY